MADQEESAVAILRRIEPVLSGIIAEVKGLRRDIVEIKVALATKPGRAELWAAMGAMVAMFTLSLAGRAIVVPLIGQATR